MKLTSIRAGRTSSGNFELLVELDGVHYEAEWFDPSTPAADLVRRLHTLAERIKRRATDGVKGGA